MLWKTVFVNVFYHIDGSWEGCEGREREKENHIKLSSGKEWFVEHLQSPFAWDLLAFPWRREQARRLPRHTQDCEVAEWFSCNLPSLWEPSSDCSTTNSHCYSPTLPHTMTPWAVCTFMYSRCDHVPVYFNLEYFWFDQSIARNICATGHILKNMYDIRDLTVGWISDCCWWKWTLWWKEETSYF